MFIFIQGEPQAQWAVQLVTQVSALTRIFYKFYKKNFIKAFLKEFSALSTAQQEIQQTNKHFYYSWRSIVVCRLLVLQVRISFYFCNMRITIALPKRLPHPTTLTKGEILGFLLQKFQDLENVSKLHQETYPEAEEHSSSPRGHCSHQVLQLQAPNVPLPLVRMLDVGALITSWVATS